MFNDNDYKIVCTNMNVQCNIRIYIYTFKTIAYIPSIPGV